LAANLGAAGALLAAAAVFAPAPATADAPKSAAECRAISDFTLRGQCWDQLDKADQKQAQDTQEAKKRGFGMPLHLPSTAAIRPRKEDLARQAKRDREEIRSQTLTLAEVQTTPLGKLLLTSSDGAVWEQTDNDTVSATLAPGDSVKVSKGMMGSYMCQVSRWEAVRCQRDR
jgi:hypothetical protein